MRSHPALCAQPYYDNGGATSPTTITNSDDDARHRWPTTRWFRHQMTTTTIDGCSKRQRQHWQHTATDDGPSRFKYRRVIFCSFSFYYVCARSPVRNLASMVDSDAAYQSIGKPAYSLDTACTWDVVLMFTSSLTVVWDPFISTLLSIIRPRTKIQISCL